MSLNSFLSIFNSNPTNSSPNSQTQKKPVTPPSTKMTIEEIWDNLIKLRNAQDCCLYKNGSLKREIEKIDYRICSLEGRSQFEKHEQSTPVYQGSLQKSDGNPFETIFQKIDKFILIDEKLNQQISHIREQINIIKRIKDIEENRDYIAREEKEISVKEEELFDLYEINLKHFLSEADAKINQCFINQNMLIEKIQELRDRILPLQASIFLNKAIKDLPKALEAQLKAKILADFAFGAARWKEYIGDVREEPSLPVHIFEILESPCPFWDNKKIKDTHLLTLIPKTVNNQPLTLSYLHKLVQNPLKGEPTKLKRISTPFERSDFISYEDVSQPYSEWVLMTRDEIDIRETEKTEQMTERRLEKVIEKNKIPYERTELLHAVTSIFMQFLWKTQRLYTCDLGYIKCNILLLKDRYNYQNDSYEVGAFNTNGLNIRSTTRLCGLSCSVRF